MGYELKLLKIYIFTGVKFPVGNDNRERADFEDLPEATAMVIQVTVMWVPDLQISEFCVVSLNQISEGVGRKGSGWEMCYL